MQADKATVKRWATDGARCTGVQGTLVEMLIEAVERGHALEIMAAERLAARGILTAIVRGANGRRLTKPPPTPKRRGRPPTKPRRDK